MAINTEGDHVKLSFLEKFSYAMGNMPGGFFGTFIGAIQAFYYAWMGLDLIYITIVQILYGVWNAINDPIFSQLEDKTRTPMGRYKPWIKRFMIPFSIGFVLVFTPPQTWRNAASGGQYQLALASWYLLSQFIYDTGFTIMYLAHCALLPQLSMDQGERVQLNIMSTVINFVGMGMGAAFPVMYLTNPNYESIRQFQTVVIIFGLVALIPWLFILKYVHERKEFIPEHQTPFWENVKYVFKNPSGRIYMLYDGISVGLLNAILTGLTFMLPWIFGLNNPYFETEWNFSNLFPYLIGPIIGLVIGIGILMWIPRKYDVKTALMFALVTQGIGFLIAFLGVILSSNLEYQAFNVPNQLWLISLGLTIAFLGFSGDFIYHNVMRAETIDYDEFITGERREVIYAGVACILSKPMISISLILVPAFMSLFGLVSSENEFASALEVKQGFRRATIGVACGVFLYPAILSILGAIAWIWYPLTRERLQEIQARLVIMHQEKRKKRINA